MATTAVEDSRTRSRLARVACAGPLSPLSVLAGVLVGYASFALLFGVTVAVLHHNSSSLDLTKGWGTFGTRGGLLLGGLLFASYLFAGYVTGRMAWRRGVAHGVMLFVSSIVIVGAVAVLVRNLAKPKDVKVVTDTLRSFGIPTTGEEWRHIWSAAGLASLGGMFLGSVIGGLFGERWFTKISRRVLVAEATEIDLRERSSHTDGPTTAESAAVSNGNGSRRAAPRPAQEDVDIDELSREELYEMAQQLDIAGRSHMSKDELKRAVKKEWRALQKQR
jgi:hypothetical protein